MKTKKHGKGMTHKQITKFSNRLAYQGIQKTNIEFFKGWNAACKYFAHELRKSLREYEQLNEI